MSKSSTNTKNIKNIKNTKNTKTPNPKNTKELEVKTLDKPASFKETGYPLYYKLVEMSKNNNKSIIDASKICQTINDMCNDEVLVRNHHLEIAKLIYYHEYLINHGVMLQKIPNGGELQHGGIGVQFKLGKLHPVLQQILAQYIEYYGEE